MAPVTSGKRVGSRHGARPPRPSRTHYRAALVVCVGITLCVVAWGYLVYAAIDFGTAARGGSGSSAWALMGLASLGAVACLFAGLLLVSRLLDVLRGSTSSPASPPPAPRPVGGKRAAR